MKLSDLHTGEYGIVENIPEGALALKLYEMGCIPGEKIYMKFKAPWGDPVAVKVSGCTISLRKADAMKIEITSCDSESIHG